MILYFESWAWAEAQLKKLFLESWLDLHDFCLDLGNSTQYHLPWNLYLCCPPNTIWIWPFTIKRWFIIFQLETIKINPKISINYFTTNGSESSPSPHHRLNVQSFYNRWRFFNIFIHTHVLCLFRFARMFHRFR